MPQTKTFSDKEFTHGWLMFDPLQGFLPKGNDDKDFDILHDACNWLMNLAYKYHCATKEESITELDHRMYHHLQPNTKKTWQKKFKEVLIIGKISIRKLRKHSTKTCPYGLLLF